MAQGVAFCYCWVEIVLVLPSSVLHLPWRTEHNGFFKDTQIQHHGLTRLLLRLLWTLIYWLMHIRCNLDQQCMQIILQWQMAENKRFNNFGTNWHKCVGSCQANCGEACVVCFCCPRLTKIKMFAGKNEWWFSSKRNDRDELIEEYLWKR